MNAEPPADQDIALVSEQLGRPARGIASIAHRCPCGLPDVVETAPRLPDGTPFPTTYYLTCPRATSDVSTLEASGMMREMTERLADDEELAAGYAAAHEDYLRRRAALGDVPEIAGISAGGMPDRVKCLHVLVAHSLAAGRGVNPLGDEALDALPQWWTPGACVSLPPTRLRARDRTAGRRVRTARVAAIDCGTNTIRLLVADISETGHISDVERRLEVVRLGQGVDRTGRFDPAALKRTLDVTFDYAQRISELGATRVRMVATSATRDAANRVELIDGVHERLGVEPEVISGAQEAALSFAGATSDLPADVRPPYLVVDIGGGSTEFVLGDSAVTAARSVDIGSVRLTERHLGDDPPTSGQVAAAAADIDTALDHVAEAVDLAAAGTVVAVAGTATTIGAIHAGLERYDRDVVHHTRIPSRAVAEISERLLASTHDERAAIGVIHPGRLDVIAAGSLILRRVVERTGAHEILISEHDILDGIAQSLVTVAH